MDEKRDHSNGLGRLKVLSGLMVVAFAVTLVIVVSNRLNDEALAVLAGTVCGVGAAIPTSLIIVAITRRRREEPPRVSPPAYQQGMYPPVVVVTPQGGQQQPSGWNALPPSLTAPVQREFTVVGGTPVNAETRFYERYS